MKLSEVLDPRTMADRIDLLNKDKTANTKTLVKLLRKKADRRNRKHDDPDDRRKQGTIDSFAGYMSNSLSQSNWG